MRVWPYLGDFTEAGRVDGPVLGNGDGVPALVLDGGAAPRGVRATATSRASVSHSASGLLPGDEGLLDLQLLSMLLHLRLLVDLVNGLGALVASPGNPVVLGGKGTIHYDSPLKAHSDEEEPL